MKHAIQVMRSATKIFSAQIIINIFSIAFIVFLARALSKTDFATFAVLGIIISITKVVVGLGLETTCIQQLPALIADGRDDEVSAMLKTTIISRIILSVLFALLIFCSSAFISGLFLKTEQYSHIIELMSLGILFFSVNDSLNLLTQVTQQFGKISAVQVIVNVLSRIASVILFLCFGLKGYIIGFCWTPIIGIILYPLLLRKWLFVRTSFYPWTKLVKYSLPYYGRDFVRFGLMQLDQFIVGIFLEPTVLATYFIAKKFSEYIFVISNAIAKPVRVKISELKRESTEKMAQAFTIASRYYAFLFIPLCMSIAAMSYPLLHLFGGYKYTNGTSILILLSMGMLMYSLLQVYAVNIVILGQPKEIFKLDTFGSLLNTIFVVIFVYLFSATGIALAKFLAFAASLFYGKYLLRKIITVKFDKKALRDSLIASVGMVSVIVFLQLIYYDLAMIPLYILAGLMTFMLIFSRRVDRKDIKLLEDFLSKQSRILKLFHFFGQRKQGPGNSNSF